MGALLEAVKAQINEAKKDPQVNYVLKELTETLAECDTISSGFKHNPRMVIIIKTDNIEELKDTDIDYLVDFDSLGKCAKDNGENIVDTYKKVLHDNDLKNESCGILINNIDLSGLYESIVKAPTPEIRNQRCNNISEYSNLIGELKANNIKIVKALN